MGSIISVAHLQAVLPSDASDTAQAITNAVNEASSLVNSWATHYLPFDEVSNAGATQAPSLVVYYCRQIAKIIYLMNIGQIFRDGSEGKTLQDDLEYYHKLVSDMSIEPTLHTKTVAFDSNYRMLIARGQNIIPSHPQCKIESGASPQNAWNIGEHFNITRGRMYDGDYEDGWYLNAVTDKAEIEGTLTYVRTYRNDGYDYMKYNNGSLGASQLVC